MTVQYGSDHDSTFFSAEYNWLYAMSRLLIYDAECPYCAGIARLTGLLSAIQLRQYQTDDVQDLLDATFPDPGFTLYLFTEDTVYWGSAAAERAAEQLRFPQILVRLITRLYPALVRLFSILSRRSGVSQPTCTCDTGVTNARSGGVQPLPDDAREPLENAAS